MRTGLPVGLVWGEEEGEILLDGDEAVRGAIQTIFDRFAELGSAGPPFLEGLLAASRLGKNQAEKV